MVIDAQPSRLALTRRARRTARELAVLHPDAHCALDFTTALELAVATILSAQCTDARVNEVTPALFARYPTAAAYASADRDELEGLIRPTGFFRNKASSLIGLGAALVERHGGQVPRSLATPSASLASPSTPTSAGWSAAWGGPSSRTRSRSRRSWPSCSRRPSGPCSATG